MEDELEEPKPEDVKILSLKQVMEILFKVLQDLDITIDLSEYVRKEELEELIKDIQSR